MDKESFLNLIILLNKLNYQLIFINLDKYYDIISYKYTFSAELMSYTNMNHLNYLKEKGYLGSILSVSLVLGDDLSLNEFCLRCDENNIMHPDLKYIQTYDNLDSLNKELMIKDIIQ